MSDQRVIGVFDSGVGGTSIWKEIVQKLPLENTIYLADSINAPYGSKSEEEILQLSIKNTEKLLDFGAKIIVVACNTATTNAITYLRATYDLPFIGIEPAIKPAALNSKTGAIGILATQGTLNSALFHNTSAQYTSGLKTIEIVGEGLVPLIEKGNLDAPELKSLLATYTKQMIDAQVDYIVLGCSHYPFLIPLLKTILPAHITIIDSGLAVARQTEHILEKHGLFNTSSKASHKLFTNGKVKVLTQFVSNLVQNKPKNTPISIAYLDF